MMCHTRTQAERNATQRALDNDCALPGKSHPTRLQRRGIESLTPHPLRLSRAPMSRQRRRLHRIRLRLRGLLRLLPFRVLLRLRASARRGGGLGFGLRGGEGGGGLGCKIGDQWVWARGRGGREGRERGTAARSDCTTRETDAVPGIFQGVKKGREWCLCSPRPTTYDLRCADTSVPAPRVPFRRTVRPRKQSKAPLKKKEASKRG
jgi:hypothetical protein